MSKTCQNSTKYLMENNTKKNYNIKVNIIVLFLIYKIGQALSI